MIAEAAWRKPLARIGAAILFAVVALAPLPFGSVSPAATALWCIVLGVDLVALAPLARGRRQTRVLVPIFLLAIAYSFALHEQLAAHPYLASVDPLWRQAAEALRSQIEPSASIARHEAFFSIGSPLVCILALICGFLVALERERAAALLETVAWSGVAYAAYGIVAYVADPTHVLWRVKPAYVGYLTSTFINRNTAAAYFGSCTVLCFVLLSDRLRRHLPRGPIEWRRAPGRILANTPREAIARFAMFFLCLSALFMTGSRGGVLVTLLALVTAFALFFRRDLPRRGRTLVVALGGVAGSLVVLELMGEGVGARFGAQGLADEGRLATWRAVLRMIADHPWFGTGQGTFAWAYPAYRTSEVSMWGVWDRAHNTLLEIAADMGAPIAVLVAAAWLAAFAFLLRGARIRRRGLIFPTAAFAIGILAVLHSLIDFSLQIPGYAIVVLALVGAGLAQSFAPEVRRRDDASTPQRSGSPRVETPDAVDV